jgi:hypothetical protein
MWTVLPDAIGVRVFHRELGEVQSIKSLVEQRPMPGLYRGTQCQLPYIRCFDNAPFFGVKFVLRLTVGPLRLGNHGRVPVPERQRNC